MDIIAHKRLLIIIVVCIVISALAAYQSYAMESTVPWYSILPPLLAVSLALVTHRLLVSFATGIFVGGILVHVPGNAGSSKAWGEGIFAGLSYVLNSLFDTTNLQIIAFVIFMLVMISLLIVAGGLQGIVNKLARLARGPRSTQIITALMGTAIFIDDYANTMLVGSSMRPMTDKYKVSREKLAFLVDATSAPIAGIAIISTWIGYEVGLFNDVGQSLGFGKTGYTMFFDALGYRFYCIMMIVFVLVNVISNKDYGAMKKAQERAMTTGALTAPDGVPMVSPTMSAALPDKNANVFARTAVIPITLLFTLLVGALWYDGGGLTILQTGIHLAWRLSTWRLILSQATNNIFILAAVSGIALIISVITSWFYAKLSMKKIGQTMVAGLRTTILPVTILVMAWSLKTTCDKLGTGTFLVEILGEILVPVWFPAMLFIFAGLTSFATGTSWGTMAILIPTAVPIAYRLDGSHYGLITMISLGAILDGSILGDHCSPISDTTIMSSISSSCDHIHHVNTQIPYCMTVGGLAIVCGYIPAAWGIPSWASILVATAIIILLFTKSR